MKCPKCGGSGKIFCSMCKGTGLYHEEDGITNEEWFDTLSTEEKATFLASNKMLNFDYQMWIEWLKEKHE